MDIVRLPRANIAVSKLWLNLVINQFGLSEAKRNRLADLLIRFLSEGDWTAVAMQEAINQLFSEM